MLDRFSYNAMYKNRFAYIVGGTVQDVSATITEDQTVVVPFKLEQDSDTGGSLAVEVKISDIVSPEVKLELIRASTGENLSSEVCEQQMCRPVWSAPLLFAYRKVSYQNLLQQNFTILASLCSWAG